MKLRLLPFFALVLTVSFFSACKKENDESYSGNPNEAYFPIKVGHYVEYDVDSTYWDDLRCLKTVHLHQQRYTITDTFTDNQGRASYRVDVLWRRADSLAWEPNSVFYVTSTPTRLEYVQNNLRFIKLIYPVSDGLQWSGNALVATNDQDLNYFFGWNYKYTNMGQSYNNGLMNFDNTVTVEETDETQNNPDTQPRDYAYRTFGKEVYAYGVGMVYREMIHWIYDPNVVSCRKGYSVIMRATKHN